MRPNPFRTLSALAAATLVVGSMHPVAAFIRLTRQASGCPSCPVVQGHWLDSDLPLLSVIDPTNDDISPAAALAVAQASAETWEAVNTSYFTVDPVEFDADDPDHGPPALDANDGQNSVFFDQEGTNFPTPGVIAFVRSIIDTTTGQTLDADMVFNDRDFFSSTTEPVTPAPPGQSAVDLQSVLTHEYGHYFGLDHTSVGQSTMIPFIISNSTVQRTLELDDRAGVSTIYPEPGPGGLSPGAIDFFATTGTVSGTVVSGFTGSAVFGAHVEAINLAAPATANTISAISGELTLRNGQGDYTIYGLPPGNYQIRIVPLDGVNTIASDGNVGGVFNGLDINFPVEFWNDANESGDGFTDDAADFTPVSVAAGADFGEVDFVTNAFAGRVIIAPYGQFENIVTFQPNGFLVVRFDLPFEVPYTIDSVSFPSFTFNGVPAAFPSVRLCPMNAATGVPDCTSPLFSQAPYNGSANGINTVPLNLTIDSPNQTLFWLVQFPPQVPPFPNNYPFMRMDFTNHDRGLFATSYVITSAGAISLLVDRNLTVSMTCRLSPDQVPIQAPANLGANRRATQTEFSYTRPADLQADEFPMPKNSLASVELIARTAFGPTAAYTTQASGGAGNSTIHISPSPSSTAVRIWSTQALDKAGRRSLQSAVTITGLSEDADEPNGRINEATALTAPVVNRAETYSPAGDQDYFSLMARSGDVIDVSATATGQDTRNDLDLVMLLFDGSGALVAFNDDSSPTTLNPRVTFTVPPSMNKAPRRYTVLVTDFYGSVLGEPSGFLQRRVVVPATYNLNATVTPP